MNDDVQLLRRYVEGGSNEAFSELVQRHVNFVYSAAMRQLNGDAHLAADATQLVFTDLARKAKSLLDHRVLAAWLFTSTRFVTAKLVRTERRRQAREGEAQLMEEITHDDPALLDWDRVRPVLDDVMGELSTADREAILLRFFEGRDYASVGTTLNVAANTARMRVDRALEKLRALLERRGVTSTSTALAAALASQAVTAAPAGLAAAVAGTALAGGAVVAVGGGATATAVAAGAFMSVTKLQIGLAGALAVAGTTGFVVQAKSHARLRDELSALLQQQQQIAALQAENVRLTRTAAEIGDLRRDDAKLAQLRDEAAALQNQMHLLAVKRSASLASAPAPRVTFNGPVFDINKLDQTPKAKFQARPSYPSEMRRAGTGGEVVVDFVVDDKGDVQNAFALRSSQSEFEAPAIEAVSKWKFQPGQKGGLAVNTHMQVPIVFTVNTGTGAGVLSWETKRSDATAPWF